MRKILTTKNLFLLTIFCAPLYLIRIEIFSVPTNIFELLMLTSILLRLKQNGMKDFKDIKYFPNFFLHSLLFILFGLVVSLIFSKNYSVGLGIIKGWFIIPIIFSFFVTRLFKAHQQMESALKIYFLSSSSVALVALSFKVFNVVTYDNRLTAFYTSPNYLAMYLVPAILIGFFKLLNAKKRNTLLIFLEIILLLALYFTKSYASMLSLLLSMTIVTLIIFPKKQKKYVLVSCLLITLFLFFIEANTPKMVSFLNNDSRSSFASRIMIWKSSLLMVENNTLFGIGPGNFQNSYLAYQRYFPPYLEWAVPQPHNVYLAFWLQTGLIGLFGFSILLYCITKNLFIYLKKDSFAEPIIAFFVYFIMHGMVDTLFWKNDLSFLFWLFVFFSISFSIHDNRQQI